AQRLDARPQLLAHLARDRFAVDDLRRHAPSEGSMWDGWEGGEGEEAGPKPRLSVAV
ncbi:MAG: hypothetical protein HY723_06490, partial [Chloroflexi bacterium]|nr:hypothetical protein [Chloroflexota bacterium]